MDVTSRSASDACAHRRDKYGKEITNRHCLLSSKNIDSGK